MAMIFAHRGDSEHCPENTMLAFQRAAEVGAHGIELDVQLSKDGVPVIMHDERLERTTNGKGYVRDHTLAELQALDARWKFGDSVPPQTVPTLREYLSFMRGTSLITNIELKTSVFEYEGIEEKVAALVQEFGLEERIWYSSFNHYSVMRAKALCPKSKCGLLLDCWIVGIGEYAKRLQVDTVNGPTPYFKREIVSELHDAGLLALAWTPNTKDQLSWLLDNGADVLITNNPELGLQVAAEKHAM